MCHVEMAVDARQKLTCKLTKNTIPRTEVCGVIDRCMICWGGGANMYVYEIFFLTTVLITSKRIHMLMVYINCQLRINKLKELIFKIVFQLILKT